MEFEEKPEGASFYAVDLQRRFEFIAWSTPPPPGDDLCRALTGRSEAQLVRDILDGKFNHLFNGEVAVC